MNLEKRARNIAFEKRLKRLERMAEEISKAGDWRARLAALSYSDLLYIVGIQIRKTEESAILIQEGCQFINYGPSNWKVLYYDGNEGLIELYGKYIDNQNYPEVPGRLHR